MNQQIAYLSQLKQTMELYQFMVKLCWLKTLLDAQNEPETPSPEVLAKEKSASGVQKIETKPCQEKSTYKSLSRQEKTKVSTIDTSEVIKGRMYDFNNGRFLSVDPYIQGVTSQAINPYSYIMNNPLSGTDPTGYRREPGDAGAHLGLAVAVGIGAVSEESAEIIEASDPAVFGGATDTGVAIKETVKTGSVIAGLKAVSTLAVTKSKKAGGRTARNNGNERQESKPRGNSKGDVSDIGSESKRTKHIDNRHVDRKKYPNKSKFKKPNQIEKINSKTVKKPDRVEDQGDRVRIEKDFKRDIGTKGERTNVTVVDKKTKKRVTQFPKKTKEQPKKKPDDEELK